jgi:RNA polymerase sigma-70 factor (ECF subfamily)
VITGDPLAAPDLAQETLLQAWLIRDRLVDPTGATRWLDAIARNVCHRWRVDRARRLAHERPTNSHEGEAHDPVAALLEREELVDLLERALSLLPDDTRAALVGRYVEDRLPADLAAGLGASPEAVSMRLTRGRARLRELLETELADDPLAQVWVERYGSAWRATRLSCPGCGRTAVAMQQDRPGAAIRWRCDHCDDGRTVGAEWRTDNPTLAGRLGDARRPSTVLARMADWAHDWWPTAIERGHAACTRCGNTAVVAPYVRAPGGKEGADERSRRGWAATCAHCGEEQSTSLLGLLVVHPDARRLRARRPRAHAVPTQSGSHDGRAALVVGLRDDSSGDGVDAVYDAETTRLLAVVTR